MTEIGFRFPPPSSPSLTEANQCPGPKDGGRWFLCSEGRCIPSHLMCDYHPDCLHGEDETDCGKEFCSVILSEIRCCVIFILTVHAEELTVSNAFVFPFYISYQLHSYTFRLPIIYTSK